MKSTRKIVSSILVVAMLSTAMPLFSPEDAVRNNTVDLQDAILHVKNLIQSANEGGDFAKKMVNTISTFSAMAGLHTVIKGDESSSSNVSPTGIDIPFLIAAFNYSDISPICLKIYGINPAYDSVNSAPASPPPQYLSIS